MLFGVIAASEVAATKAEDRGDSSATLESNRTEESDTGPEDKEAAEDSDTGTARVVVRVDCPQQPGRTLSASRISCKAEVQTNFETDSRGLQAMRSSTDRDTSGQDELSGRYR